jgi:hypothetical protein
MERYQVTVNKDSGIKNDPNDWADEVGNPRYILDLLLSVINLSVQTVDIVAGLPTLKGLGEEPAKVEEVEEDQQIFKQLSELDKADNWFDSLSVLNKYCNELLNNEQYDDCNRFIADFLNREFSLRLHLGLLTATNRRKKHLESRNLLYEKAKELALEVMTPEQTKTALRQLA